MKRDNFRYIATLFIMSFVAALSLCSCSKDDDVESGSSTGSNDSNSWYFCEDRNAFNNTQANADYNSNKLNYYNYIDESGRLKRGGGKTFIHFLNSNTLEVWYFELGVAGCQQSLSSQYYVSTSYYIGKDKLIYYSVSHSTYTYVEVDGKLLVTNGDLYTRTSNGIIKDGTSEVLQKGTVNASNFSKEKQISDACAKVSATRTCNYNNLTCALIFNSSLGSQFPNESIVYGVEYGINICETTLESESRNNPVTMQFDMIDQVKRPYEAIILKLLNKGTLTSSEKSFYDKWHLSIQDMMKRGNHNFVTKCYVRYGGTKYYVVQ